MQSLYENTQFSYKSVNTSASFNISIEKRAEATKCRLSSVIKIRNNSWSHHWCYHWTRSVNAPWPLWARTWSHLCVDASGPRGSSSPADRHTDQRPVKHNWNSSNTTESMLGNHSSLSSCPLNPKNGIFHTELHYIYLYDVLSFYCPLGWHFDLKTDRNIIFTIITVIIIIRSNTVVVVMVVAVEV